MEGARRGKVESYDDHAGFGWLVADDDGARLWFHCTQVADGTRHVDPGTPVSFAVVPGHLGRWEAAAVSAS